MEKYNQLTPEIIAQIQAVSEHVLVGDDINVDFARDEMPIYGTHMPDLVVQPTSTEEVAAVMKVCNENKIAVTPSGARTALTGGPERRRHRSCRRRGSVAWRRAHRYLQNEPDLKLRYGELRSRD